MVKVNGAVPPTGVTVILPLLAPEQLVAVADVVAVNAGPGLTIILLSVTVHPLISVIITVCVPAATLLKVKGLAPGTAAAPSKDQVNGAAPDVAFTSIDPLVAVGQVVAVGVAVPVIPAPAITVTEMGAELQPVASVTTIV